MNKIKGLTILIIILVLCTSYLNSFAEDFSVQTVSGNGEAQYKDGKLLQASFNRPYGLAVTKDGGLIVVDTYNNRIRKILGESVTTLAGNTRKTDNFGFPLGGLIDGNASEAMFNHPKDVVINTKGDIYVSDTGNNVIRKISGDKVYTFAGTSNAGYTDGAASKAEFNRPLGMDIDNYGNIYVADSLNNVIRKITPQGQVSTYAGQYLKKGGYADGTVLSAVFNEPSDIAVDSNGNLYVADSGNQVIRKIENGMVSTLAGLKGDLIEGTEYGQGGFANGNYNKAKFNFPKGIHITDKGVILIADTWNHRLRAINSDGNVVTVAGKGLPGKENGKPSTSSFNGPVDIVTYKDKIYISDMWNNCIRVMPISSETFTGVVDREELLENIDLPVSKKQMTVWVNNKEVVFPDEKPYISNGSIYVPLRFLCQAWGANVKWIPETSQVEITKGDFYKTLTFGKDKIFLYGERTFIESDDFKSLTGLRLEWFPDYNTIIVIE